MTAGVQIDRRLEIKPVHRKQVGGAAAALPNVVQKLTLPIYQRVAGALKAHPDFARLRIDAILDLRLLVAELASDQVVRCRSAGVSMRSTNK
jgi:hypothetical protein